MTQGEIVQTVDRYYSCLVALPKAQIRLKCLQEELCRLVWREPPKVRVARYVGMPGFSGDGDGSFMCDFIAGSDIAYDNYSKDIEVIRQKLYLQASTIRDALNFVAYFEEAFYQLAIKDEHIIRLRHQEGWTTASIGELLGITRQGASARYTTAMSHLGILLEGSEVQIAVSH